MLVADLDLGLAELVRAQAAFGVGELGADAGGAGLVVDLGRRPSVTVPVLRARSLAGDR